MNQSFQQGGFDTVSRLLYVASHMPPTNPKKKPTQAVVRIREADWKILMALQVKLGLDNSEITRMAWRVLAAKEGVAA